MGGVSGSLAGDTDVSTEQGSQTALLTLGVNRPVTMQDPGICNKEYGTIVQENSRENKHKITRQDDFLQQEIPRCDKDNSFLAAQLLSLQKLMRSESIFWLIRIRTSHVVAV